MLAIRLWTPEDVDLLVAVYTDPAMRRWVRIPIGTPTDAAAWVTAQQEGWCTGDRLSFAVDDETGLVGCVVLKRPHTNAEVGYWTAPRARGRGVATRAVDALSTWAFATYGLDRLALLHQVDNVASCRVAEKAGYTIHSTVPAEPPFPLPGHRHLRHARPDAERSATDTTE